MTRNRVITSSQVVCPSHEDSRPASIHNSSQHQKSVILTSSPEKQELEEITKKKVDGTNKILKVSEKSEAKMLVLFNL